MYIPPYNPHQDSSTQLTPKIEHFTQFTNQHLLNNRNVFAKFNLDSKLAEYNKSTLTVLSLELKTVSNYTADNFYDENLELSIKLKPKNTFKIRAKIVSITKSKPKFELY